jgi:O-acetylserine/cysteine efflux transporter
MTLPHLLLALAAVLVWGMNYMAIAWGLRDLTPLLLAALRFTFAAVPLVLFLPRPRVPLRLLAAYSACMFVLEFALLYGGIKAGVPAGIAPLVMQLQVFITMALALGFLGERPRPLQWAGAAIGFAGIALVGLHMPSRSSLLGFTMVLGAALAWALGNHLTKLIGRVDPLALVVWCSLLTVPALLAASVWLDGPAALRRCAALFTWRDLALVLFQAYAATLFGFTVWSFLLRRYPAALVAPLSMLVPVVGMGLGAPLLGEPVTAWKVGAAALVLGGLWVNHWASFRAAPGPAGRRDLLSGPTLH